MHFTVVRNQEHFVNFIYIFIESVNKCNYVFKFYIHFDVLIVSFISFLEKPL